MSWQGTDGPGRGIGSVPSEALAPACSASRIESVMMYRVLGGPPQIQREAAGRKRCPETGVERIKGRATETGWGAQRLRERGSETQRKERDPERRGQISRQRETDIQSRRE